MTIDPRQNVSKDRREQISRDLDLLRKTGFFQRGAEVNARPHDADRIGGAFAIDLPFSHTFLPVLLMYPAKKNAAPEIYLQHESFRGFAPDLGELKKYGPLQNEMSTVHLLRELLQAASEFQLMLLRDHIFADEEVKTTFVSLAEKIPDSVEIMMTPLVVQWTVRLPLCIASPFPIKGQALLKGSTSLGKLADTKVSMEFNGTFAKFFKGTEVKYSVPPYNSIEEPLHEYVDKIRRNLLATVKYLYLSIVEMDCSVYDDLDDVSQLPKEVKK